MHCQRGARRRRATLSLSNGGGSSLHSIKTPGTLSSSWVLKIEHPRELQLGPYPPLGKCRPFSRVRWEWIQPVLEPHPLSRAARWLSRHSAPPRCEDWGFETSPRQNFKARLSPGRSPGKVSGSPPTLRSTVRRRSITFGAGNSNLKSDQSVDSVISTAFADTSRSRLLEVSEVPRICIARGRNGSVGDTSLRNMLGPSPIPAFPDLPRTKQCGGDDSAAERPARECAPNKLY